MVQHISACFERCFYLNLFFSFCTCDFFASQNVHGMHLHGTDTWAHTKYIVLFHFDITQLNKMHILNVQRQRVKKNKLVYGMPNIKQMPQ